MWTDSIRVRTESGMQTRRFRYWASHHGPIVGVADATRLIPSGATVCLDGDRGSVRLMSLAEDRGLIGPLSAASIACYVVTLLVLSLSAQRLRMPKADGMPYRKGQGK